MSVLPQYLQQEVGWLQVVFESIGIKAALSGLQEKGLQYIARATVALETAIVQVHG